MLSGGRSNRQGAANNGTPTWAVICRPMRADTGGVGEGKSWMEHRRGWTTGGAQGSRDGAGTGWAKAGPARRWPPVGAELAIGAARAARPYALGGAGPSAWAVARLPYSALARVRGHSLHVPRGRPRLHVAMAGLLNVAGFNLCSAFAQLGTSTSRAAICAYTMPIWTILLARPVLGSGSTATAAWRSRPEPGACWCCSGRLPLRGCL